MSRLRAYFVHAVEEAEGQAIIASTSREAKLFFDYSEWGIEFIDIRSRWIKGVNVEGLEKGLVNDEEALRRKMYSWLDNGKCDVCSFEGYVEEYKGEIMCEKCLEATA